MLGALIVSALCFGIFGAMLLSQATVGLGLIGLGCLIAVLARIAQAERYHKEQLAAAKEG